MTMKVLITPCRLAEDTERSRWCGIPEGISGSRIREPLGRFGYRGSFPPEWATPHTKMFTTPKIGYPYRWHTKRAPKTPSDLFRVGCPQSTDSTDFGHDRHVNEFHHAISQY